MKKTLIIVGAVIVVAAIVYVASRGSGTPATDTTATSNTPASSGASNAAPAQPKETVALPPSQTIPSKTITVEINGFAFNPKAIVVAPGTQVTWVNEDSAAHTVTSIPGGPNSVELAKGATYSFTFKTAGVYNYHCSIHPGMTGTVTVANS